MLQKETDSPEFNDLCYEIYKFRMNEEVITLDEEVLTSSEKRLKEKLVA